MSQIILVAAALTVTVLVGRILVSLPAWRLSVPDERARRITLGLPVLIGLACLAAVAAGVVADNAELALIPFLLCFSLAVPAVLLRRADPEPPQTPLTEIYRDISSLGDPRIAFHFSDADLLTPTHVEMWADALDATGIEWYVICREPHHHEHFRMTGRARSVLAEKAAFLTAAVHPGVRTILYANNAQKNREMLKACDHLTHVQMLHGDSDKPPSYSPLTRNFDKVFVSGQMGQDRYAVNGVFIPEEKFVHVGRPQAVGMGVGKRTEVREVVYMPTWLGRFEDTQFSSVRKAHLVIGEIARRFPDLRITFKPHPLTFRDPEWPVLERKIRSALRSGNGRFAPPEMSSGDAYRLADVLITDISSTMIDFLHTGRPQVLILPSGQDLPASRFPSLAAAYQVSPDLSDLTALFSDAIGPDSLEETRLKMRRYAFGEPDGPADAAFIRAILSLSLT